MHKKDRPRQDRLMVASSPPLGASYIAISLTPAPAFARAAPVCWRRDRAYQCSIESNGCLDSSKHCKDQYDYEQQS
jgi:hypothetical protein